jgi:hypothetical protein
MSVQEGGLVFKNKKLSFTTSGIVLALLATLIYSASANANPSDPEVYEFTITPSTVDLSSSNPTLRIRIGVRDADEVRGAAGSCETEPPGGYSGFSYQVEYFGDNFEPIDIFNDHVSTSGDSFDFLVESEIRLAEYEVGLGTHLCKLQAWDWDFNSVETSTRFTVIDSSVRTPGPSSSSPSPVSSSSPTSSSRPSATKSASPTLEEQLGSADEEGIGASRGPTNGSSVTESKEGGLDPASLIIVTVLVTSLILGAGIFLWQKKGSRL